MVRYFMATHINELARWNHIRNTQCAYRSTHAQTKTARCRHLFTNTSECEFYGCPIVQKQYIGLQREGDVILLISKNENPTSNLDTWKVEELPADKDKAKAKVEKTAKVMHPSIGEAVTKKFDYLFQITETIRQSEKEENEEEA